MQKAFTPEVVLKAVVGFFNNQHISLDRALSSWFKGARKFLNKMQKYYHIDKVKPLFTKYPKYWEKGQIDVPERQPLTSQEMLDASVRVRENVMQGKRGYTLITFANKFQSYCKKAYKLHNTEIVAKVVGSEEYAFLYIREDEDLSANIAIDSEMRQAILLISWPGNDVEIMELSDFCMLTVSDKKEDCEAGAFTLYSKEHELFCFHTLIGSPNLNYAELSKSADMNEIPDDDEVSLASVKEAGKVVIESDGSMIITARKIVDNVKQGKKDNLSVDLYDKIISTQHGDFQLRDIGMDIKISGRVGAGYKYVGADDLLEATIYVGDVDGDGKNFKAFLVATANETQAVVFEIDDLFLFAVDHNGIQQLAVYHNHNPFEDKMALLFSNDSPLPFVPVILDAIKHSKLSDYVAGLLNKKAPTDMIQPLSPQEKHDFTEYRQAEMCCQLAAFDEQDMSQRPLPDTDRPGILACADILQPENQTLTQEQMRDACETINKKICQDSWFNEEIGFHTDFDFLRFRQRRCGDTFYLSDAVICLKGLEGGSTICSNLPEFDRLNANVSIGDYDGATRAFLEAAWIDGKYHYAELSEFSILSTFEVDGRNLGIVTIFSKDLGVTHFDVYCGSPRKKHAPRTDIPAGAKAPKNRGAYIIASDDGADTLADAFKVEVK